MTTWPWLGPLLGAALLGAALLLPLSTPLVVACVVGLIAAVIAAVHHAEVVAHRVGEPYGTLVLALSITVIEVALILSVMLTGGPDKAALARDTIYATVMIIVNGVVGVCVLVGAIAHHEQSFRTEGAGPALAALVTLATLALVLPAVTTSSPGNTYTTSQLVFEAVVSVAVWAIFVFVQTVRHRDYFLPPDHIDDPSVHGEPPTTLTAWASFGLLFVSLVSVVGLAKMLSPSIEAAADAAEAPKVVIGIAIAILVLLPETSAAVRQAHANRLQNSMNLALGSALASIGLTIPAVAIASIQLDLPLVLGLEPKDIVLLMLTFVVAAITLGSGRTNVMQGAVHLVIFAAFLCLAMVP